jgi:hypothetical protein
MISINNQQTMLYKKELFEIKRVVELNDFQMMLTIKDKRGKNSRFKLTDNLDLGYNKRERTVEELMQLFRTSYKIRGSIYNNDEFFYYAINESGLSSNKVLHQDSAHIHLLIGFYEDSKFKDNPDAYIDEFMIRAVHGGRSIHPNKRDKTYKKWIKVNYLEYLEEIKNGAMVKEELTNGRRVRFVRKDFYKQYKAKFPYLDICTSYKNNGEDNIILFKNKVVEYFSKSEQGFINGEYFFKKPFFGGNIKFPKRKEYPVEYLEYHDGYL